MSDELSLPIDGAEKQLARFDARLRRDWRTFGLTLWTETLKLWHDLIRDRQAEACEQLMQLEHEVQAGAPAPALLARIAKAKGLLAALMLGIFFYTLAAVGDDDQAARRIVKRGRGRRREETELVEDGAGLDPEDFDHVEEC